jgi:D-alanyl-D-alanine dipeptidase
MNTFLRMAGRLIGVICLSMMLVVVILGCTSTAPTQDAQIETNPSDQPQQEVVEEQIEVVTEPQQPTFTLVTMEPQSAAIPLPEGFAYIDKSIICEIRYATSYNFVGVPIDGYEKPVGILSVEASEALTRANALAMEQGFRLKVFDAYRPYRAHEHFVRWGEDLSDTLMQDEFYPGMDKSVLFHGYIALYGDPHSSGSTVDLTLVDMISGVELDMGSHYDLLAPISQYYSTAITYDQRENRTVLRNIMIESGFIPYDGEWWDFTLGNEPYPTTYFDFPVS